MLLLDKWLVPFLGNSAHFGIFGKQKSFLLLACKKLVIYIKLHCQTCFSLIRMLYCFYSSVGSFALFILFFIIFLFYFFTIVFLALFSLALKHQRMNNFFKFHFGSNNLAIAIRVSRSYEFILRFVFMNWFHPVSAIRSAMCDLCRSSCYESVNFKSLSCW